MLTNIALYNALASSPQGSGPDWLLSSPAHDKRASHRVSVVVAEWLYYSKRIFIVRWADLTEFFVDFRRKNVCFCFTSNENCHFSLEKR